MSLSKWTRDLERQRKAAERAAQKQQRELERARKDAEKTAHQRHLGLRESETNLRNMELENKLESLNNILETALKRKFIFDTAIANAIDPIAIPPVPRTPPPSPPDKQYFESQVPKAGLLEKMTGIGRVYRLAQYDEIKKRYDQAVGAYKIEKTKYDTAVRASQQAVEARDRAIAELRGQVLAKDPKALIRYFTSILEHSEYPAFFPKVKVKLSYNHETGELVLEYDLPKYEQVIPSVKGYKYVKSHDKIQELNPTQTDERRMKALYEDVIAAITLKTLYELFQSDQGQALNLVIFNGMVNTVDKATGKDIRPCLVSVQVTREEFATLDLARVDKATCLRHLKAQTSSSYRELVPVKPLVELVTTDSRFVEQSDVLSTLDSRPNLYDMTPADFEQLVSNLFAKMGFKTGTTRLRRDGGVDVIAFDERPILGGKVVIQAKRYRHTVDVESVRALYGVMQDEGATKGILVTTSSFGTASREFVKGKPIELIDGNGLLYFLGKQGFKAKIELPRS